MKRAKRNFVGLLCACIAVGVSLALRVGWMPISALHIGERWQLWDDTQQVSVPVAPAWRLAHDGPDGAVGRLIDYVRLSGARVIDLAGAYPDKNRPADTRKQNEMVLQRKVFLAPVGTACIVMDVSLPRKTALVRIVGGPHDGEMGVVYTAWLQRADAPTWFLRTDATDRRIRIDGEQTIRDLLEGNPNVMSYYFDGAKPEPELYP